MSTLPLKAIVEKLTPQARLSLEKAAACASSRSHFSVDIGHWLFELVNSQSHDFLRIARHFHVDEAQWCADLNQHLERQKTGSGDVPGLSQGTVELLSQAWMSATIAFNDQHIDVVHILFTLLNDDGGLLMPSQLTSQLQRIDPQRLLESWQEGINSSDAAPISKRGMSAHTPGLDQYTIDLTEQARSGKLDPVVGRDDEIRLMIDILMRRRQNNPILTGEAGVGKTAVVEGLAQKIVDGDVPDALKPVVIKTLDLALLQAGAGVKGEFENRLKTVVNEVKNSATPIILFIDEAHGLIGSNGEAGGDAANILKPALARGELRTIAATTWAEYKKHIEKDAALTRRFQLIHIDEPDVDTAIRMLRGLVSMMESHHGVRITAKALDAAVRLSDRYIHGRQLPDKAVSLLDTACSRVALSQTVLPATLDRLDKQITAAESEQAQLFREVQLGEDHDQVLAKLERQLGEMREQRETLQTQWQSEEQVVNSVLTLQQQILDEPEGNSDRLAELKSQQAVLAEHELPMIHAAVNELLVAEIISDWTGIPVGRMQTDEIGGLLALKDRLCQRVLGQNHGLQRMAEVVQTARAGLNDEKKPNGVFFLTGPSGVGKTESALALAEAVYGSEDNITVINMSEFKEEHKVSMLLGSPPGYVGYGEGGVLTEAVRRKPYSVILLDEMEKAHPGVQDIFYQIFDKGNVKDGEGRDIDFRNTIIIMTSNAGTETTMSLCEDPELAPTPEALKEALRDDLLTHFKPAFLGRINVIPYLPLNRKVLNGIIDLQLSRVEKRLSLNYGAELILDDKVKESILSRCNEADSGARVIQNILQNEVLPLMSECVLTALAERQKFSQVSLGFENDKCQVNLA